MPTKSPDTEAMPEAEALSLLGQWIASGHPVSLLYSRADGQTMAALRGTLKGTPSGVIEVRGPSSIFTMNLQRSSFEYGPISTFHHHIGFHASQDGLHAWTPEGDWLFLTTATISLPDDGTFLDSGE